jgi:hypothetical protein
MVTDTPTAEQLSQVIAQVAAPSFLLGAVAAFISLLISRMNRVIDRIQALNSIADGDETKAHLKEGIPRLKRRAHLLNKAILFAATSAIVTCLLVIVAFTAAFFQMKHEYGVAVLFVLALVFFTASLTNLVRETRIALHEYDLYS